MAAYATIIIENGLSVLLVLILVGNNVIDGCVKLGARFFFNQ